MYLFVGATSVGVDLGLLVALREGAGVPVWAAATIGYWSSVVVNFTLNRRISFRDRPGGRTALIRFSILLGLNWFLTLVAVSAAVHLGWSYAVGKVGAVAVLTILNYTAYSRWVFAEQRVHHELPRPTDAVASPTGGVGKGGSPKAADLDGPS